MLYIIATPIGNLEDITLRALRILKSVAYILCEDTRVSKKLLDHYEIKGKKLISYHHHTNENKIQEIIELIKNNEVALITDAGTPGISDPGNQLISMLVGAQNLVPLQIAPASIIPIPGPSALISALSISGLPTDKFIFKGFVPHKKGRETFLREVLSAEETVVFYESCHRILKFLEQFSVICRDRSRPVQMVVCRELTKKFETIYRGTANEILEQIKKEFPTGTPKGEFVVVVG